MLDLSSTGKGANAVYLCSRGVTSRGCYYSAISGTLIGAPQNQGVGSHEASQDWSTELIPIQTEELIWPRTMAL